MKTFNEAQMADPWAWCRQMIDKHEVDSKELADITGAPRSTIRSLYNGTNSSPRYQLLCLIIELCIKFENGEMNLREVPPGHKSKEYEFL